MPKNKGFSELPNQDDGEINVAFESTSNKLDIDEDDTYYNENEYNDNTNYNHKDLTVNKKPTKESVIESEEYDEVEEDGTSRVSFESNTWLDRAAKPWTSATKRQRTLVIVIASFAVLLILIALIIVPFTSRNKVTRTYYIAAIPHSDWDYTNGAKINKVFHRKFNSYEKGFLSNDKTRIGSVYDKAIFVEYEDAKFTKRKPVPARDQYMGLIGPVIRAVVGDAIEVHFKNLLPFNTSLHATGLRVEQSEDGLGYLGETEQHARVSEESGVVVYHWDVPARAGPAVGDLSSVVWTYYSAVNELRDFHSGMIGPIVVTKKESAYEDTATPTDVKREIFLLAATFDENLSYYMPENIEKFTKKPADANKLFKEEDEDFLESNQMHTINGYVFGTGPLIKFEKGEKVRWYILGAQNKQHIIRWNGNALEVSGSRSDTIAVFPGASITADMSADVSGSWLISAIGADAIKGMQALYEISD